MTVEQIINLANQLSQKTGNYVGTPGIEESLSQLDWAMKVLAEKARFEDHSVRFRLKSGVRDYKFLDKLAFSKRVIRVKSVYINGSPLLALSGYPGLWSISELDERYPTWRNYDSGASSVAVSFGRGSVMLFPAPSEDLAQANNHFVYAEIVPGYIDQEDGYYRDIDDLKRSPYGYGLGLGEGATATDLSEGGGGSSSGGGSGGGSGGEGGDGGPLETLCDESEPGIGADGSLIWPCWDEELGDGA